MYNPITPNYNPYIEDTKKLIEQVEYLKEKTTSIRLCIDILASTIEKRDQQFAIFGLEKLVEDLQQIDTQALSTDLKIFTKIYAKTQ